MSRPDIFDPQNVLTFYVLEAPVLGIESSQIEKTTIAHCTSFEVLQTLLEHQVTTLASHLEVLGTEMA